MQRAAVIQSWRFADDLRLSTTDRVWTTYPFFWSAGICMALGATMAAGATLVLQETFEPGAALQCLVDERANATQCWPHQAKAMAEHPLYATLDFPTSTRKSVACNRTSIPRRMYGAPRAPSA